jgi:hypothetical protein
LLDFHIDLVVSNSYLFPIHDHIAVFYDATPRLKVSLNSPRSERRSYGGVSNFSTQQVWLRGGATLLFHYAEVRTGPTRAVPRSGEEKQKPPPVCCRCHGVSTPTRLYSPVRKDLYCYSTISFRATDYIEVL